MFFFFQAEDGIRDLTVTGVQTCALPICSADAIQDRALRAAGNRSAAHHAATEGSSMDRHPVLGSTPGGDRITTARYRSVTSDSALWRRPRRVSGLHRDDDGVGQHEYVGGGVRAGVIWV